jgi:hypothetical protein
VIVRKIVLISWLDIVARADWVGDIKTVIEELKPESCLTVGWLIHDGKEFLIVADSVTKDKDFGGVTVIPRAVITKIETLAEITPASRLKKI